MGTCMYTLPISTEANSILVKGGYDRFCGFHAEFLGLNEHIQNFMIQDRADATFGHGNGEQVGVKTIGTTLAQKMGQ